MKRESTEQIMVRALESLLDEGVPFERVTVNAIVARCEASKTTFYNHFHDKYDLMIWYLKGFFNSSLEGHDPQSWVEACVESSRLIREKASYFQAVVDYEGQNSLRSYLMEYNTLAFTESLRKATGLEELTSDYGYAVTAFIAGSTALVLDWIRGGCEQTPEEMTRIICDTAPRSLAFFFESESPRS